MINESDESLDDLATTARKISQTVKTPGWTDIIRPALDRRLSELKEQLLTETEHLKMIQIQQGAMAITNLLSFVEQSLADGDAARQEGRRRQGLSEHPA